MTDDRSNTDQIKDTLNEKLIDPMKRAGAAIKESGEKLAESGSAVGTKVLDQVEENAREAFAAMRAAATAKDISEVMKIQAEYLREQGSRSMAQAREIGELIMRFGRESAAPFRKDDVPGG